MAAPLISIVIPSFNQGAYLDQSIRSVLDQDYPEVELIVIDGGSTDASLEIILRHEKRIAKWVSEPDRSQSHAINKGFAHATGEIVTFLSSDDTYLPGAFPDAAEKFNQSPGAGAISGAFRFLDEGESQPGEAIMPRLAEGSPRDLSLGPPGVYRLHQVATFFSRAALESIGMYVREDLKYVMDRELLYRICRSYPIVLSTTAYGIFRRHSDSKSVSDILPFAREFSRLYELHFSGVPAEDKCRKRMARYRLARGHMKFADAVGSLPASLFHALRAGILDPSLFGSPAYWAKIRQVGLYSRN